MKRTKSIMIVLVCMLLSMVMPVSAQSNISKDESVYAILDSKGNESEIIVSEWLHSDNGFNNYQDTSILTNIKPLNSDNPITVNNQKITFNTSENDIYYQGNSDKELPFKIDVTYFLDNKEYEAQDLLNKSGHLKIKINVENKLKNNQVLPLVIMTNLNNEEFSNIRVDHGEIITDGMNQMLMMATIIGLKDIASDIDLIDVNEYLHDSFIIECDAKDMSIPSIMGASAFKNDISLDDFNIDTSSMNDDLNKLKDATKEIVDGTTKLKDANIELANKMNEFQSSVSEFKNATKTLKDNTKQLSDGMSQMNQGIQNLAKTLETLMNEINKLSKEDLALLKNTLNGLLTNMPNIQGQLKTMKDAINSTKDKLNNIDQVIISSVTDDKLYAIYGLTSEGVVVKLKDNIGVGIDNAIDNTQIDSNLFINQENLSNLVTKLVEAGLSEDEAKNLAFSILNVDALSGIKEGIKNDLKTNINNGLDNAKKDITDVNVGATKKLVASLAKNIKDTLEANTNQMMTMLEEAEKMLDGVANSVDTINGIINKLDIQKIMTILDQMMNDKAALTTLQNASLTINDGLNKLYDGCTKIDGASQKILDATNEFKKATDTLKDKTSELNDGTIKFSKEGIDALDERLHDLLDKFNTIENKLNLITANQNVYANYGGVSDNTNASVKFIFKTQEINKKIVNNDITISQNDKVAKMNFFDRIINLFK